MRIFTPGRRRFAASGLADIPTWDDESVRARLAELQTMLENFPVERAGQERDDCNAEPVDVETLGRQIAEANRQIASDLAEAGLTIEDIKGDTGDWLRVMARAERARESLERIKNEHKCLRAEAAALRDQLLRYLHARGVKSTDTGDTAAAIAEQLKRLSEPS